MRLLLRRRAVALHRVRLRDRRMRGAAHTTHTKRRGSAAQEGLGLLRPCGLLLTPRSGASVVPARRLTHPHVRDIGDDGRVRPHPGARSSSAQHREHVCRSSSAEAHAQHVRVSARRALTARRAHLDAPGPRPRRRSAAQRRVLCPFSCASPAHTDALGRARAPPLPRRSAAVRRLARRASDAAELEDGARANGRPSFIFL
jgi:hypothetical protein